MQTFGYLKNKNMIDLENIHIILLNRFLKYEQPKMYWVCNKPPFLADGHFMYYRVIIISDNVVYKIHPGEYVEQQKWLVQNLNLFFKQYSQPLDITEHYKEDLCWTTWTRIPGETLGKERLENNIWNDYLDYVVDIWNECYTRSKELNTPKGQMWWHHDVTPWNVIKQTDDTFFLIDWDDFCLMNINETKQTIITQNIEFAEMYNQDTDLLYNKLQDL